jgi:hypothetical protein
MYFIYPITMKFKIKHPSSLVEIMQQKKKIFHCPDLLILRA